MKTVETKVYKFNELSEKVQERIINNWRENDFWYEFDELKDSLENFCNILGLKIKNYEINEPGRSYIHVDYIDSLNPEYEINDPVRLWKYFWNNHGYKFQKKKTYYKHYHKERESKIIYEPWNNSYFTGLYSDLELLDPIIKYHKNPNYTDSISDLINECIESWFNICIKSLENFYSEECIKEEIEINNYDFFENGELY